MCALSVSLLGATAASGGRAGRVLQPDDFGRFPRVEGVNLEGRRFVLPADLDGHLNVVVIAFRREQQRDVDGWMPFLAQLAAERSELRVYELPMLGRLYRPMRPFIDGGMRRGIPDAAVRAATVTLYVDKSAVRRALRLDGENSIYVLLIDRDGRVYWRADGPFDAHLAKGLQQALDAHPSPERQAGGRPSSADGDAGRS